MIHGLTRTCLWLWGHLAFAHMNTLVRQGHSASGCAAALPALPPDLEPQHQRYQLSCLAAQTPLQLLWRLLCLIPQEVKAVGIMVLLATSLRLAFPPLLALTIRTLEGSQQQPASAVVMVLTLAAVLVGGQVAGQWHLHRIVHSQQVLLNIISRALVRSSGQKRQMPLAGMLNLLGSDAEQLAIFVRVGADMLLALGTGLFAALLLGQQVGSVAAFALLLMLGVGLCSHLLTKGMSRLDARMRCLRDERMSKLGELVAGIDTLKALGWEGALLQRLTGIRQRELSCQRRLAVLKTVTSTLYMAAPVASLILIFNAKGTSGQGMDAALAFACISLVSTISNAVSSLPMQLADAISAWNSASRLLPYLGKGRAQNAAEKPLACTARLSLKVDGEDVRAPDGRILAANVRLHLQAGESLAVVGAMGVGKSSLVQALSLSELGALYDGDGKRVDGVIGYAPQEPFVLNASIAENIIWGAEEASPGLLAEALRLTCLEADVRLLAGGAAAACGETGSLLSGGQRQRLALARVVACQPQVVMLDEPVSAVDPATSKRIYDELLFGHWRHHTRVVVTRDTTHLQRFDHVLVLNGHDWYVTNPAAYLKSLSALPADRAHHLHQEASEGLTQQQGLPLPPPCEESLINPSGAISWSLYAKLMQTLQGQTPWRGRLALTALFGMSALGVALPLLQHAWLAFWQGRSKALSPLEQGWQLLVGGTPLSEQAGLGIYTGLGVAAILLLAVSKVAWAQLAVMCAKAVHERALQAVVATHVQFFKTNSLGFLVNRFSRDLEVVERELFPSLEQTILSLVSLVVTLTLLLLTLPPLLLLLLPFGVRFVRLQHGFRQASREVKRLLAEARSPLLGSYHEVLSGAGLGRAMACREHLDNRVFVALSHYQRVFYAMVQLNRWFSTRAPLLTAGILVAASLLCVYLVYHNALAVGMVGFVALCGLELAQKLDASIRNWCELETKMTGFERLMSLAGLPPEEELIPDMETSYQPTWCQAPEISLRRVAARYAPSLPPVFADLSVDIPAGAAVAVVGRTGCGKSTLLHLLTRCLEPSAGTLHIGGCDSRTTPLKQWRQAISVVSQVPYLFEGTIASNIDMTGRFDEAAVWSLMTDHHLAPFLKAFPQGLATPVQAGDGRLSLGQKQLLCLCRALLHGAKLIILDESTAHLDGESCHLVQQFVSSYRGRATILMVAHREEALGACDYVLTLGGGQASLVGA